jgi:hypothetical protein
VVLSLGRVDKAHPAMDGGKLDEAEEAFGGLVVARRDAAKLPQQTHHALDAVAPGIAAPVQRAGRFAVRLPWDDRARAAQIQLRAQAVGVITFVGEQFARPGLAKREQVQRGGDVGGLARRQMQGQGQSICDRQDVDLGRDPATGSAQSIQINPPFWAPALCWCAPSRACLHALPGNGITVLSIIWPARSPAPLATSASRIASNIPASHHRANLHQTVFHLPKRSGRSRHGEPVRAIQKIPSRTRRLSIEGRQARQRIGGRTGASSTHVASSMRFRSKAGSQFPALNHADGAMGIPFVHTA